MSKMTDVEYLQRRDIWTSNGNTLMSKEDVERLDDFFSDPEESAQFKNEGFIRAQAGDFCQFESVEPMLKGYLGAKKCYDLYERYKGDASNVQLQQEIKDRLMEVDLRTGFAFGGKDPENPVSAFLKECERIANRQMLMQTLEEPDPTAKLRLLNQLERENPDTAQQTLHTMLDNDLEQRVEIAKILFMNHLGKFQTYDQQGEPMAMDENMAEIYAHGGRTMFILPAGADQNRVMDGIQGQHTEQSGLTSRRFATHAVEPRTFNKDGTIASEAKELKVRLLSTYAPDNHRGMNVSVGGLGHIGPNGKLITSDGTNGHMYMHLVPGEKNTCGMMLVGFENAGPGEKGRLGHAHDASAKKAGSSAFLSDKSYLGKETGGRVVDLSGLSGEKLSSLLTAFENNYRRAAQAAQEGNPQLLDACNDMLTGKLMSAGQVKGMLQGLGVEETEIASVDLARAGYTQAKDKAQEEAEVIPMKLAENPPKKTVRITECEGLERPTPPRFMKKPNLWDKIVHFFTLHSKNSYVSRYEEYQRTLQGNIDAYQNNMKAYRDTLESLQQGNDANDLKANYDQAARHAKDVFGVEVEEPVVANVPINPEERKVVSQEKIEQLENTLVETLFADIDAPEGAEQELANMKIDFLERMRNTEGFNKLVNSSDEHISEVLNDSKKIELVLSDISREMKEWEMANEKPPKENVQQNNKEIKTEQVDKASNFLGINF